MEYEMDLYKQQLWDCIQQVLEQEDDPFDVDFD